MILDSIIRHEEYMKKCLPLIASENVVSLNVQRALLSDLNNRYAEGLPGNRLYPGNIYVDEIELETQRLLCKLFNAEFADVRVLSGSQANLVVYTAFTNPGDTIIKLGLVNGGHITAGSRRLGGLAGLVCKLETTGFPFNEKKFNIDVDETKKLFIGLTKVNRTPKLAMFGASVFLFPHPVKELSEFMKPYGTIIVYDAAHVAGLIAGRQFQDPLREGVDLMTMSTHKTFFGPQHGAIVGRKEYEARIHKAVFPAIVSNHHLGAMAGVGIAAEEMYKYGALYAFEVIRTAKRLAEELVVLDYDVISNEEEYTMSHQIVIDTHTRSLGLKKMYEEYNILLNDVWLPWNRRSIGFATGIRLGVQELVRRGFTHGKVLELTELLNLECVSKSEVEEFMKQYQGVKYCDK